jgi:hypothetical protein
MPEIWFDITKKREDTFNPRENWIYYRQGGVEKSFYSSIVIKI